MRESEWLTCRDTDPMLRLLQRRKRRPSARKQRLFACACCRRIWASLDGCCRRAVETAERYADDQVSRAELNHCHDAAMNAHRPRESKLQQLQRHARLTLDSHDPVLIAKRAWDAVEGACRPAAALPGKTTLGAAQCAMLVRGETDALDEELAAQADILRDLVGDPFGGEGAVEPCWLAWNDGVVARLARGIYEEHAFERMPVLGDALPEAGCRDEAVLEHCRSAIVHHRGCWVVDRLLGLY